MIAGREFPPQFKLETALKDAELVRELAAGAGVELALLDETVAQFAKAVALGHGSEDMSATWYATRAACVSEGAPARSRPGGRGLRLACPDGAAAAHLRHARAVVRGGRCAGLPCRERFAPLGTATRSYAGLRRTALSRTDGREERVAARFARRNANGFPAYFGVLAVRVGADCRAQWYRVELPMRPNGATGWMRAASLRVRSTPLRIEVSVSTRQLTLFRPRPTASSRRPSPSGSAATPTPIGRYYVNQRLVPDRHERPLRPGGARHLGVLAGAHRLGAGRPGRDPRDERAVVDRPCGLERLHPAPERDARAALPAAARRDAGDNPSVTPTGRRRRWRRKRTRPAHEPRRRSDRQGFAEPEPSHRVVQAAMQLKDRVDDLSKRVRGLEGMEKRWASSRSASRSSRARRSARRRARRRRAATKKPE